MLSHAEVKGMLPHRYPMLLVDAVRSIDRWVSIVGIKNVTANEPCFADLGEATAPEAYAYPCSLILESLAQTAGILLNGHWQELAEADDVVLLFAGLAGARFTGEDVFPGDTLEHRTRLRKQPSDVAILSGEVWVREKLIAEIDRIVVTYRRLGAAGRGRMPGGEAPASQVDQGGGEP
jgi:3-hydroxyacyl-[acyl-carrier-protein] dehydratase